MTAESLAGGLLLSGVVLIALAGYALVGMALTIIDRINKRRFHGKTNHQPH